MRELARVADVLVENYSNGVMDRIGLSYEVLHTDNPRLVYATIRGFGDPRTGDSPYRNWPAYDVVAQAVGGFLGITGTAEGTPIKSGPGIGDLFPAVLLAIGILAALHHATVTGQGQFVDVAMYDAILSMCERIVTSTPTPARYRRSRATLTRCCARSTSCPPPTAGWRWLPTMSSGPSSLTRSADPIWPPTSVMPPTRQGCETGARYWRR